jgi:hypothetical protein
MYHNCMKLYIKVTIILSQNFNKFYLQNNSFTTVIITLLDCALHVQYTVKLTTTNRLTQMPGLCFQQISGQFAFSAF